jgi:replicative DNA helicase
VTGKGFESTEAERGFIGALLCRPGRTGDAAALVQPDDLLAPAVKNIYVAMLTLWGRGVEPSGETIRDELRAHDLFDRIGGDTIVHLMADVTFPDPERYIPSILEHSLRRRVIVRCRQAQEIASDPDVSASDALDQARELFAGIEVPTDTPDESVDIETFCAGVDEFDWLVPNLIERNERIIIVAGEAQGKSMLLRQLAVCCAYGIHPFSFQPVEPMRVLLLDLENPQSLIRRKVRPMVTKAQSVRPMVERGNLRIITRPGGIDVTKRTDARWLAGQLSATRPDLLIAGPLYKMFDADEKWEQGARVVTSMLDDLRTRVGFSLVLETHAPQATGGQQRNLRPIGSSLWMRWPEFGLSFAPVGESTPHIMKVRTWKSRDERHWPGWIERGGAWPWTPTGDPVRASSSSVPYDPGPSYQPFDQGEF